MLFNLQSKMFKSSVFVAILCFAFLIDEMQSCINLPNIGKGRRKRAIDGDLFNVNDCPADHSEVEDDISKIPVNGRGKGETAIPRKIRTRK